MFSNKLVVLSFLVTLSMPNVVWAETVTPEVKQVEDWPVLYQGKALPDKSSPDVATESQGGPLTVDDDRTALTDRAAYWDSHGRGDLADKARAQLKQMDARQHVDGLSVSPENRVKPAAASVALSPDRIASLPGADKVKTQPSSDMGSQLPVVEQSVVQPKKPDAEEMARYWDARGRSDLAGQLRNQSVEKDALQQRPLLIAPQIVQRAIPDTPADAQLGAQQYTQSSDEKARYWEEHGRSDLAGQLRQKLAEGEHFPKETARVTREPVPHESVARSDRTALEDSLLKNPGSLQTRLDLAQVYRGAGEMAKARLQIDSVLAERPDLPEALFASAQLYAQQRLWPETLYTLEKVLPVSRSADMARLQKTAWAHVQIDRADALARQGRNQEAEVLLRRVAAELAVNENQNVLPEPPPLWKNDGKAPRMP